MDGGDETILSLGLGALDSLVEPVASDGEASSTTSSQRQASSRFFFALVAPRAGAQDELLVQLQTTIVAPMASQERLVEFRVLAATPPSFVADSSTVLIFELVVPTPRSITDVEVKSWRQAFGPHMRLVVSAPPPTTGPSTWDWERARSVLARAALVEPPVELGRRSRSHTNTRTNVAGYIAACFHREAPEHISPDSGDAEDSIWLCCRDVVSGRLERLPRGGTLLTTHIAAELRRHLPAAVQWRTAWRLAYSPRVHGVSLSTFFRQMEKEHESLLILQDHKGRVFGAYTPSTWHISDRYYGGGESFIFRSRKRFPKALRTAAGTAAELSGDQRGSEGTAPGTDTLRNPAKLSEKQRDGAETNPSTDDPKVLAARGDQDTATASPTDAIVSQALAVLEQWAKERQAEADRVASAKKQADLVTSSTEALDAILGAPFGGSSGAAAEAVGGDAAADSSTLPTSASNSDAAAADCDADDGSGSDAEDATLFKKNIGLEVFGWSGSEPYFFFSDAECLAVGGGAGFAFYIEKDLLHGMSEACPTFGSPMLSSSKSFIVNEMECWAFDDPTWAPRPGEALADCCPR